MNEFKYGLDEDINTNLILMQNKVFVAYSWSWIEEDGLRKSDEAIEVAGNEDTDDSEESSTITHTLTLNFKCIGVNHERAVTKVAILEILVLL